MGLLIAAADIYIYVSFGRECLLPIVYVWVSTLAAKGKNPLVYRLEYVIHRRTGCRRAVSQPSLKAKNTFGTRLQAPTFPSSATSQHLFFLEPVRLGTFPVPELAVKAVRPSSQGRGTETASAKHSPKPGPNFGWLDLASGAPAVVRAARHQHRCGPFCLEPVQRMPGRVGKGVPNL